MNAAVFAGVDPDKKSETVHGIYPSLIARRAGAVRIFHTPEEFHDIGSPKDYLDTAIKMANREGRPLDRGEGSVIAPDATLVNTVVWDRVTIGANARLSHCVVADDVAVPAGAHHSDCSLVMRGHEMIAALLMEPRLEQYLSGQQLDTHTVVPLTGDASDRRYFRVLLKDAKPIVLALHQGPIDFDSMPFVAVARLLAEVPLPVPRILHHSNELGILGLEDLGDVTLQAHLGAATAGEHAALYRQAVTLIARMQQRGEALRSENPPNVRPRQKLTGAGIFLAHYRRLQGFPPRRRGA